MVLEVFHNFFFLFVFFNYFNFFNALSLFCFGLHLLGDEGDTALNFLGEGGEFVVLCFLFDGFVEAEEGGEGAFIFHLFMVHLVYLANN